jgi:hypothetical protein
MRTSRNIIAIALTTLAGVASSASMAFAHGGMAGPDELGRPLAASAALAFICYWAVMLWPSSRRDDTTSGQKKPRKRNRARRATSGAQGGGLGVDSLKVIGRRNDG